MDNYKYRNKSRVEYLLSDEKKFNITYNDLKFLCLYYRDELGYKPKKRKEELHSFLIKNIDNYNFVKYFELVNRAVNYSRDKKHKLIQIDYIPIYKSEIEYINSLDLEYNMKKILFAVLFKIKVSSEINYILKGEKYTEYFLGRHTYINELLRLANLSITKKHTSYFYYLNRDNYINTYMTGATKIETFYNMPVNRFDIALKIEYFDCVGLYYDYYNKKNRVKLCEVCEKPFRTTANSNKYCKEHQEYYTKQETKIITCIDCGKEVEIYAKDTKTERCPECYKKHRRELKKIEKRRNRKLQKLNELKEN